MLQNHQTGVFRAFGGHCLFRWQSVPGPTEQGFARMSPRLSTASCTDRRDNFQALKRLPVALQRLSLGFGLDFFALEGANLVAHHLGHAGQLPTVDLTRCIPQL